MKKIVVIGLLLILGLMVFKQHNSGDLPIIDGAKVCEQTTPIFTYSPVDLDVITLIQPPIMQVGSGIKSHSYFNVTQPSPVYAPVDGTLIRGVKYAEQYINPDQEQYTFLFNVTCNVAYYYDHLINPPEKIAEQFPGEPQTDTHSNQTFDLEVKAGELVGYTWSPNFDFGVLDYTTEPALADFEEYRNSEKAYAVCPLEFFTEDLKHALITKLGYSDASDLTVINNLCASYL